MRKSIFYLFVSVSAACLLLSVACTKSGIPNNIPGTWKLILTGGSNSNHRIDTFKMKRSNDSILQEYITFNTDDSTGILHLVGLGHDSAKVYSWMDSVYNFSWIYFSDGPEIWITLKDNPKNCFNIWTDSNNVHLHVNYHDNMYLCDYYSLINSAIIIGDTSNQEIFQRQ